MELDRWISATLRAACAHGALAIRDGCNADPVQVLVDHPGSSTSTLTHTGNALRVTLSPCDETDPPLMGAIYPPSGQVPNCPHVYFHANGELI